MTALTTSTPDYSSLLNKIDNLWTEARNRFISEVNTQLLEANWETGRYIVEFEQGGNIRADYGKKLLTNLSRDLTTIKGKGFSRSNLTYMRKLYLTFPKRETLSHKLTWSHYFELLKSSLFHRIALSSDKDGVLALAHHGQQVLTPQDILHDPYVLEFTGFPVKKQYKESELETALKNNMEQFLLELGRGFAFVGRQYIIPIGSRQFKIDLVFYHCILKCYVLIDLKRDEIGHGDIGQMNLYLNYFKSEICQPDDNPPIGIVLGARKDELLMEYALQGITNQLFVARYQLYLPKKEELQQRLDMLLSNPQSSEE